MCAGVQPLGSLPGKLAGPLSSSYHHQEAMSKPIQTHTPISSTGTCPLPLPFAQVSPLPTQHEENLGFYDVATLVQPFSRFICSPSHIPLTQGLKDQLLFSLSPWAAPEGISLRSKLCLYLLRCVLEWSYTSWTVQQWGGGGISEPEQPMDRMHSLTF